MSSFKSAGPYFDSFTHVKYVYYSYAKGKSTHIVKEFLLSESKNEIDFLATINQQPQLLIIGTQLICLWASKTDNEFLRKLLTLTI